MPLFCVVESRLKAEIKRGLALLLRFHNNAVAVALAFGWKLVPVSIADREQLVVFSGRGVALPFELKLDGFREVLYREQLRGFICIDIGLRAFDFCGDIERKAAKCAQEGVSFFEGERGESCFGIERVQLISYGARLFGRIKAHQGEDVGPNGLLEADVDRKGALFDVEGRVVDFD